MKSESEVAQSCPTLSDPMDCSLTGSSIHGICLDSILKTETLPTKFHLVKAMVFPVVMYGCVSWTIKKAECQRTDASELWCWRRFLDCKIKPVNPKGNQSWVFIGGIDIDAETPILWPHDAKS